MPRAAVKEITIASGTEPYEPVAALCSSDGHLITSRWRPSWFERCRILFGGNIYLQVDAYRLPHLIIVRTDEPGPWEV